MVTFSIAQWQGWTPHLADAQAWQQWARAPGFDADAAPAAPRLDFLPPMQRRRLSPMARAVFACAWPLAQDPMPLVFASRHGETSRSFELLQTLAADAALSPTAFCLSVHNAIAAQWSIVRGETCESVALAAEADGLEHAFLEAALLLAEGHPSVLVVLTEDAAPAPYAPWLADVPAAYAAAFVLNPGADWRLSLCPADDLRDAPEDASLPNPLSLLRHLLLGTSAWQHASGARRWQWTRLCTRQP